MKKWPIREFIGGLFSDVEYTGGSLKTQILREKTILTFYNVKKTYYGRKILTHFRHFINLIYKFFDIMNSLAIIRRQ